MTFRFGSGPAGQGQQNKAASVAMLVALLFLCSGLAAAQEVQVRINGVDDARGRTLALEDLGGVAVDAGSVDALGHRLPRSGRYVRWREGGGASLVWTFQAVVTHPAVSARFELACNNSDAEGFRYALGDNTRWDSASAGLPLPRAGSALVHPALLSGQRLIFQVAMPIRDQDKAAYRRPSLHYHVELNGRPRALGLPPGWLLRPSPSPPRPRMQP